MIKLTGNLYPVLRNVIFYLTRQNPENAHRILISYAQFISRFPLNRLTADLDSENLAVSNAAGFNKNGDIPDYFLWACGFDRNVIGTVTLHKRNGNPIPRCFRIEENQSFINYMGLPNDGASATAERLKRPSRNAKLPKTINFAYVSQTEHTTRDITSEIKQILKYFSPIKSIDRLELNISCPNVESHQQNSGDLFFEETRIKIDAVNSVRETGQKLYLKVSPDMEQRDYDVLIGFYKDKKIDGFTLCNTSTNKELSGKFSNYKGGLSGNGVFQLSRKVRTYFLKQGEIPGNALIACGGISDGDKTKNELTNGICEIQIYTPIIYQGFNVLKTLKAPK